MKFYRGSPAAARNYVEADRSRADEYYLAEGSGYAQRWEATAGGVVTGLPALAGDGYEAWVAGVDPDTGVPRGRVRLDEHAVRFAEVVVNGPKSWSLAAELHPEIAAAYEAAQEAAAVEIVRWFGQHATTRVGPRGAQVATPVERIEAVTVRHYTSRAGDPHRHLHVQINARVQAAGKWRGVDTVAVRDSIAAVHGIGHAAMVTDPRFRAVLAASGYTLDPQSGEIPQLAGYVGPFSKRAEQIAQQIAGYEAEWRAANPDHEPGPALRRAWDDRGWADRRPGKGKGETAGEARGRWAAELADLGYRQPGRPVSARPAAVGQLDRAGAAAEILARLTAARSAWNMADLRGEAELLIARQEVVTDPAIRTELAEDLTARAAAGCVPLLDRHVPDHVRAWTSPAAVAVEEDLAGRLAVRGAEPAADATGEQVAAAAAAVGAQLDPAQAEAVAALAGGHALVLVTGAAGVGKTTTLAAAKAALAAGGHQLLVVTPTLKAARTARVETGARAGSAAWLAHQHGWRWDGAGAWTRLQPGQVDPATGAVYAGPGEAARLRAGDLLVVDEAGMADQDTARALLTLADEQQARVALLGDPHQLPAIGRGGVLDLARRWAERAVTLDVVHRFTRPTEVAPGVPGTVEDVDYAELSLRMRGGEEPGGVFDRLAARGQVRLYPDEAALREAVAAAAAQSRRDGQPTAVAVDTREQACAVSAAVREQLVQAGVVDDNATTVTAAGERLGTGDLIATRRNDRGADVANRDLWTVTAVHPDGSLTVTGASGDRTLTAGYTAEHVDLAYASTVHGVQGDTAHTGHLILGERTGAAAAYVGMTRGRTANTVHILAADLPAARQLWVDTAGRGRADLGVTAARSAAERAAAPYTSPQPPAAVVAAPATLDRLLAELPVAWTEQARAGAILDLLERRLAAAEAAAQADAARRAADERTLAPLREKAHTTAAEAERAEQQAAAARAVLDRHAADTAAQLHQEWAADRPAAAAAAATVLRGPGRFGHRRAAVRDAEQQLSSWAGKWQAVQPTLTDTAAAAARYAAAPPAGDRIDAAIAAHARRRTAADLPEQVQHVRTAEETRQNAQDAASTYQQATTAAQQRQAVSAPFIRPPDPTQLTRLTEQTTAARARLQAADQRVAELTTHPAITTRHAGGAILDDAHTRWNNDRQTALTTAARQAQHAARQAEAAARQRLTDPAPHRGPSYGGDISRRGPRPGR